MRTSIACLLLFALGAAASCTAADANLDKAVGGQLVLSVDRQSAPADGNSPIAIEATLRDVDGLPLAGYPVAITADDANVVVVLAGPTDARGTASATMTSASAGSVVVRAALALPNGATLAAADVAVSFAPVAVPAVFIEQQSKAAVADGQATVQISVRGTDCTGGPAAGAVLQLTGLVPEDVLSPNVLLLDGAGTYVGALRSTRAGPRCLVARMGPQWAEQAIAFVAGPVSLAHSGLAVEERVASGDGNDGLNLTLQLADAWGNAVGDQAVSLASTAAGSTLSPASGHTDSNGRFVAKWHSEQLGTLQVAAEVAGGALMGTGSFVVGPSSPVRSNVSVPAQPIVVSATTATGGRVTLRDAAGHPLANAPVALKLTGLPSEQAMLAANANETDANGTVAFEVRSTAAGTAQLRASSAGLKLDQEVTFVAGAANVALSSLALAANQCVAVGTSPLFALSLQAIDDFGNPLAGRPVAWSATGGNNVFTADANVLDGNGRLRAGYSSIRAENKTLFAQLGNATLQANVCLLPGSPNARNTSVAIAPIGTLADGLAPAWATARVVDDYGNGVGGASVTFASSDAFARIAAGPFVTDLAGKAVSSIRSYVAAPVVVTARALGRGATKAAHFVATGASCTGSLRLGTAGQVPTFGPGRAAALADATGDGLPDLLFVADAAQGFGLAAGLGNATFAAPVGYALPGPAFALQAADLNHDGTLDVAISCGNGYLAVLLGLGTNTLVAAAPSAMQTGARSLALADLNGDAALDVVVGSVAHGQVQVLLGHGDGTFGPPTSYPAGVAPAAIALVDLDGDGVLDLLAADQSASAFYVWQGDSSGAFHLRASATTDLGAAVDLVAGRFATSGHVDVVVSAAGHSDYFVGDGAFGFAAPQAAPAMGYVAAVDFDGDANLDLLHAAQDASLGGQLAVHYGTGDGQFAASSGAMLVSAEPRAPAVADLNADGLPDLVVLSAAGYAEVLVQAANRTLQQPLRLPAPAAPSLAFAADLDGDGKQDVVAYAPAGLLLAYLGDGHGGFGPAKTTTISMLPPVADAQWSDLTGDGLPDLALLSAAPPQLCPFVSDANGAFVAGPCMGPGLGTTPSQMAAADFDMDGLTDLMVASASDNAGFFLPGLGDGTFGAATPTISCFGISGLAAGDFDEDGLPDIGAVGDQLQGALLFVGNGDGTFIERTYVAIATGPHRAIAADVDGDGHVDLVGAQRTVTVVRGAGDGTLRGVSELAPFSADTFGWPIVQAAGDIDGDHLADLVALSQQSAGAFVLRGNQTALPSVAGAYGRLLVPATSDCRHHAVGDFDGDGKMDVVLAGWPDNGLVVHRSLGCQ